MKTGYTPNMQPGTPAYEYYSTWPDMTGLTATRLADYHLSVLALQMDGQSVFLSESAYGMAADHIGRTHHDLLLGSSDAISREIGGGGGATVHTSEHASHWPSMKSSITDSRYDPYRHVFAPEMVDTNSPVPPDPPFARLVLGMRYELGRQSADTQTSRTITRDIARLGNMYFDDVRSDEEKQATAHGEVYEPEDRWLEFTEYVENLIDAIDQHGDVAPETLIRATRLINAAHTRGASILERFFYSDLELMDSDPTKQTKSGAAKATLDATHESSNDALLARAGWLGNQLNGYLTGKKQSIQRLHSGRSVPEELRRFRA